MAWSRPLILNPLQGHAQDQRRISSNELWGTIKELAQLDGAFIVSDEGVFIAAGRYLDANASNVQVSFGLGSRHIAAASISFATNAAAIVVSESSIVRVLEHGVLVAEIIPELWLFSRHEMALRGRDQQGRTPSHCCGDRPPKMAEECGQMSYTGGSVLLAAGSGGSSDPSVKGRQPSIEFRVTALRWV
jgi:hypothetical protein